MLSLSSSEQERHLKTIIDNLSGSDKGVASQRQIHLINYVGSISSHPQIASYLVNKGLLPALAKLVKDSQPFDM